MKKWLSFHQALRQRSAFLALCRGFVQGCRLPSEGLALTNAFSCRQNASGAAPALTRLGIDRTHFAYRMPRSAVVTEDRIGHVGSQTQVTGRSP
jgi:hypothetical protein